MLSVWHWMILQRRLSCELRWLREERLRRGRHGFDRSASTTTLDYCGRTDPSATHDEEGLSGERSATPFLSHGWRVDNYIPVLQSKGEPIFFRTNGEMVKKPFVREGCNILLSHGLRVESYIPVSLSRGATIFFRHERRNAKNPLWERRASSSSNDWSVESYISVLQSKREPIFSPRMEEWKKIPLWERSAISSHLTAGWWIATFLFAIERWAYLLLSFSLLLNLSSGLLSFHRLKHRYLIFI